MEHAKVHKLLWRLRTTYADTITVDRQELLDILDAYGVERHTPDELRELRSELDELRNELDELEDARGELEVARSRVQALEAKLQAGS